MKISEWLSGLDSHTIYDTGLFDSMPDIVQYVKAQNELSANGKVVLSPARPVKTMRKKEGAFETRNPKGAYLDVNLDDSLMCFGGFELAAALDRLLTDENAGSQYFGRGTAFRANIKHLAEKGF